MALRHESADSEEDHEGLGCHFGQGLSATLARLNCLKDKLTLVVGRQAIRNIKCFETLYQANKVDKGLGLLLRSQTSLERLLDPVLGDVDSLLQLRICM